MEYTSTPVEACSVKPPLISCGMPHAYSTTSWPRAISPRASECTLPCSATMIEASSSLRELSSSRKLKSTVVRLATEALRQSAKAAAAAATAWSTSAISAKST